MCVYVYVNIQNNERQLALGHSAQISRLSDCVAYDPGTLLKSTQCQDEACNVPETANAEVEQLNLLVQKWLPNIACVIMQQIRKT